MEGGSAGSWRTADYLFSEDADCPDTLRWDWWPLDRSTTTNLANCTSFKKRKLCLAGYLRAGITSGTGWWFFTACFCWPASSDRAWGRWASAITCFLQPRCSMVSGTIVWSKNKQTNKQPKENKQDSCGTTWQSKCLYCRIAFLMYLPCVLKKWGTLSGGWFGRVRISNLSNQ